MKNNNINRIVALLVLVVMMTCSLSSCLNLNFIIPNVHECESICSICGKCTDFACTESACADKCQGHQVTPPAHTCESKCAECGKCTDSACTESACADKCKGHQVTPPAHTCESKCAECGKCTNSACTESACADKCQGHSNTGDTEIGYVYDSFDLNLMSFNIRTLASESKPINNWANRKDAVVNFINNCGADIIGMQEVRKTQFDYINSTKDSKYSGIYFPREGGSDPEGLAFLYDSTKFRFISSEKYWLSETPDTQSKGWGESYYRIAAIIILEHIESGEIVKSINTHGPLNSTANTNAYQLIMDRSVNEGDPFTFLCGDFNATPNNMGYVPVANELQDCRVTAETSSTRDHITFQSWGGYADGNDVSHIIDFCFVSKGDNVQVKSYEVRTDKWGDGNYVSDHYAVQTVVTVSYKSEMPEFTENGFDGDIDPA